MKMFVLSIVALTVLAGAALPRAEPNPTQTTAREAVRGSLVSFDLIETKARSELQVTAAEFPGGISVVAGARLYRLRYWTEFRGRPVIASGLVSAPMLEVAIRGVVLYAHGTTMTRALSPSRPDRADGNEETAVFAGNGYLVLLPDYVGLGDSPLRQAYSIVRPQVDASIDMLRAVRTVANREHWDLRPSLLLMGFSQGGQTVAGVHRALEREPLHGYRLRGTVAVAGPHNLRALSVSKTHVPEALEPINVGYLAFAVLAYADYYDVPLRTAMTPTYAQRAIEAFDGTKSLEEIVRLLPSDARLLFQPDFLRSLQANGDNWLTRALDENETFAWVPRAPIRIVFGEADKNVPAASSRALYDYASRRGGAVSLHDMGAADHMTTAALSYAPTLAWFDTLTGGERGP